MIDDSRHQLRKEIIVPVSAFKGDSSASIEEPRIGDCGVHCVVPKVLSEGDTGQPVVGVGISIDVVFAGIV